METKSGRYGRWKVYKKKGASLFILPFFQHPNMRKKAATDGRCRRLLNSKSGGRSFGKKIWGMSGVDPGLLAILEADPEAAREFMLNKLYLTKCWEKYPLPCEFFLKAQKGGAKPRFELNAKGEPCSKLRSLGFKTILRTIVTQANMDNITKEELKKYGQ